MYEAFKPSSKQMSEMGQKKILKEYKQSLKNLKNSFPDEWQEIVIKLSAKTLKKKKKKNEP